MSWNVCNLFDDIDNGTEYPEFDPSAGFWNSSLYHQRLKNTGEIIIKSSPPDGPDIICFQEIENIKVLKDLAATSLADYSYDYIICADNEDSAITTGIISRYPLKNMYQHAVFLENSDRLRSILEAEAVIPPGTNNLFLFNAHFKSKLGGDEQTEPARIAAAGAVRERCVEIHSSHPDAEIVITGDLNENIDEYERQGGRYITAVMNISQTANYFPNDIFIVTETPESTKSGEGKPVFYSPWLEGKENGSYLYRNIWNTIDHFLLSAPLFNKKGIEYEGFRVFNNEDFTDSQGAPLKWNSRTGTGYSDHFPILLFLSNR